MQKLFLTLLIFIFAPSVLTNASDGDKNTVSEQVPVSTCRLLYMAMGLEGKVDYEAFEQAYTGYEKVHNKRSKDILALVDFSKPSTEERLFIIDMENHKLLYQTHVAHGKNSGGNYATSFSNVSGSNKSSLGFYLTHNTYDGRNGYSLRLEGLESGINDKAMQRAIVIHGADYANPDMIAAAGRLGRSLGCPAIPEELTEEIIDVLKDGALLYIYAGSSDYLRRSPILSPKG